jgi:solute carrier family 25 oxoglutarate transporter 11
MGEFLTNFVFGGVSGCTATLCVHPLDMIRVRLQTQTTQLGVVRLTRSIVSNEGPLAIYSGFSAGVARQLSYGTTRFGLYSVLMDQYSAGTKVPFLTKLCFGLTAGGIGALVGNPAEVALVRMTADGRLPVAERRGYKHFGDALLKISKHEGASALWRGVIPTVSRAMVLNAAQLGTYSQAKDFFLSESTGLEEGVFLHFLASLVSGFSASVVSVPFDFVKTRIQQMKTINGVPEYTGVGDIILQTVKQKGVRGLWSGFLPFFFKLTPHTVISLIVLEQLRGSRQNS